MLSLFVVALSLFSAISASMDVYLFNAETSMQSHETLDQDESQVLLSHFLGDGQQPYMESIAKSFPAQMFQYKDSQVFLVSNLDKEQANNVLGTPSFQIGRCALNHYNHHSNVKKVDAKSSEFTELVNKARADDENRYMLINISSNKTESKSKFVPRAAVGLLSAYESEEQCMESTNQCSGHGKCVLGSNGKYACKCSPTQKDGKRISWGGKDCSKRDVSFQFNLIVGTTLALLVAGVLSINLLFKLGSEPIPSILNTTSL